MRLQRGFAESPAAAGSKTDPECARHLCGHPGKLATLGGSEHWLMDTTDQRHCSRNGTSSRPSSSCDFPWGTSVDTVLVYCGGQTAEGTSRMGWECKQTGEEHRDVK